jgi:hypothetical protein
VVISRRHLHLVIALLLPLMVLRAMLPAGYMPVAENGTLRIAMCSDGFQPAATDQSGDHQLPSNSGDCPFANAAVNAPPPAVSQSIVTIESDAGTAPAIAAPARSVSIVRVQSARGPPSFSL